MTGGTGEPTGGHVDAAHESDPDPTVALPLAPAAELPPAPPGPASRPVPDAPPPEPDPPRFGQLTYTAFHRADGVGGWQVKDVSGRISDEEQRPLVERATGLVVGKLPRFLPPDQVDGLPRRLVYGPVRESAAAYWHSAPAGTDSSGRPGNVFAHIVLDRLPATPTPALRPSDLLRSTTWLRPFTAERVLAADLTAVPDPPWPDGGYTRAAVLEFLVDRAVWRTGTLLGLLDAVHAAMEDAQKGPMVVLGVEDPTSAEMWIAAVCHLMSPGTSRRLYFSTNERATGLASARAAGLHLVVVPCADLREIEPDDDAFALISDEAGAVEFVEYAESDEDQAHTTTPYGSRIPVTPWSAVAAVVLRDPDVADAMLALQDDIAAEVGDRGLGCGWPLAMAVVMTAQVNRADGVDVEDALPAATVLARTRPPDGIVPGTQIHRTVRLLRERSLGRSAADALAAATRRAPGDDRAFALGVYLERALADREWLLRPEGVPVPVAPDDRLDTEVTTRAREALVRVCAGPAPGPAPGPALDRELTGAVEALRVLDVVVRAGLVAVRPRPDPTDVGLVDAVLDRLAGPLLLDAAAGPVLVGRVGPLAEATQATFVRPWFDARLPGLPGPVGCRLSPLLLRWLFPVPPAPPTPEQLAQPALLAATLLEVAAQATAVLPDPSVFRSTAVAARLPTAPEDLARTALGPPLPIAELAAVVGAFGPDTLVALLPAALLSEPAGPALNAVVDRVRTAGDPSSAGPAGVAAREAADLRHLASIWFRSGADDPHAVVATFVERLEHVFFRPPAERPITLSRDLLHSGMAADVVDRIYRMSPPTRPAPLVLHRDRAASWEDERTMRAIARIVADATRNRVAGDLNIVLAAQLSVWTVAGLQLHQSWWSEFAHVRWTPAGGPPQRLLDQVVRDLAKGYGPDHRAELVHDARHQVEQLVCDPGYHLDVHAAMHDYDEFAGRWWPSVGVSPAARRRWL